MRSHHSPPSELTNGDSTRLTKEFRLRSKDVEFDVHTIVVRHSKGSEDRVAMLLATREGSLRL